jgi:hypothetical protein
VGLDGGSWIPPKAHDQGTRLKYVPECPAGKIFLNNFLKILAGEKPSRNKSIQKNLQKFSKTK